MICLPTPSIQKLIKQKIETIDAPAAAAERAPEEPRKAENRADRDRRKDGRSDKPEKRRDDRRREEPRAARPEGNGARPRRFEAVDDGPDEGWNGPVPEFLSVGFGA